MYSRPHSLLEQVPLTVSPFINLPAANALSYNYKQMPSTLPPSILNPAPSSNERHAASVAPSGPNGANAPPDASRHKYVVSSNGGHTAHPDEIIASCRALHAYIEKLQRDADQELRAFEERARQRDLAEKRRVAPGWLDSEARLLEPERTGGLSGLAGLTELTEGLAGVSLAGGVSTVDTSTASGAPGTVEGASEMATDEGMELDRAFGNMYMRD